MKNLIVILLLVMVLVSCQDVRRSPKPDDLIPEKEMVEVLIDLSLLHGARTYNKNLFEEKGIQPYSYLWEKHRIDSSQFARSNEYYSQNYRQYKRIYDSVQSRLELLRVKYDTLREREERRKDSILELEKERDSTKTKELKNDSLKEFKPARGMPRPVSRRMPDLEEFDSIR